MAHPGESDEAYARRLAMEDGSHAVPMGGVPMRHGGFPSHAAYPQVVHGVPVATVVSDAPSGGGSGSGSAFGQPTIVQVTGQPVHIVGGPLRPGQRVGGPALAIVDTTAGVSRRLADGKLLTVFQLSRSVKLFAMLDMFFIVLWSLSIPLLLLAIVLPALGYWGAKNFTAGPVWAYVVFIVLHIMGRVAYVGMAEGMVMWVVLINLLGIMVEAYILRIVWAFLQLLRTCSAAEQHDLREVSTAHHW